MKDAPPSGGASRGGSLESSPQSPLASSALIAFQTRQQVPVPKQIAASMAGSILAEVIG